MSTVSDEAGSGHVRSWPINDCSRERSFP